jgi:hypothetical protein
MEGIIVKSIFILCGGYEWKSELAMNKLAKFVLNKFSKPKILDVWFAMKEEKYRKTGGLFCVAYHKGVRRATATGNCSLQMVF